MSNNNTASYNTPVYKMLTKHWKNTKLFYFNVKSEILGIDHNDLTGSIPSELGQLKNMALFIAGKIIEKCSRLSYDGNH